MRTITVKELKDELNNGLATLTVELEALKAVQINTKHKTLTNRAVTGGHIGDYLNINKALYVSYQVKRDNGSTQYLTRDITAYSHQDENGKELGVDGFIRITRTITPAELEKRVEEVKSGIQKSIDSVKSELDKAEETVARYNKLAEEINAHNDTISSYSNIARIKV